VSDEVSELSLDLSSPDPKKRGDAAQRLARLGEEARAAAIPLVRATADDDEQVREWATAALEELGPPAIDDLEALSALLPEDQADVGYWAATLLGRLREQAAPAVLALITALVDSPHPQVRQRAAWALGRIGPQAKSAINRLEQAARSKDSRLAKLAERAIVQIRGR
jgi:HEAT repeat protein